jgi:hypothetical protein
MSCEHCGEDGTFMGGHNPSRCRDVLKARLAQYITANHDEWINVMRIKDATIDTMQKETLEFRDRAVAAEAKLAEYERWSNILDEWEDDIRAAFPTRSGSHEEYDTAMRMVSNRHSKHELVALVTLSQLGCSFSCQKERTDAAETRLRELEERYARFRIAFGVDARVSELERALESVTKNLEEHIAAGTVLCDDCNDSVMAARAALRKPEIRLADAKS